MRELMNYLWQTMPELIAALLGTLGFALVFKMKWSYMWIVSVGGFFTYAIFVILAYLNFSDFSTALISAVFFALTSEILARVLKAPTIVFLIPISISIVPGSGLYYSMRYLLLQDTANFVSSFKSTCAISAGIVCGIIVTSVVFKIVIVFCIHVSHE